MEAGVRAEERELHAVKYWTLVWLIVTAGEDGGVESRLYQSAIVYTSLEQCLQVQEILDEKLLDEGYDNFTTSCEEREIG